MFALNYSRALLFVSILSIVSCSPKKQSAVDSADSIVLTFFNGGDTLMKSVTSKNIIKDFRTVLGGKMQEVKCSASGAVAFYSGNALVYSVYFSTDATGSNDNCQYLMLDDKGWRLTYNVGMFLDETFSNLKRVQ